MNELTYIVRGIIVGPYVLDAEVFVEEESGILNVYTFGWTKEEEEVGAEHYKALDDFYFEEIVTVIVRSLELEGVFLDDS